MVEKKYLSLGGLQKYDALFKQDIRAYVDEQVENAKQIIVTVNQSTGKASMTSSEIFTAIGNGSSVILALEIESRVAFLSIYGWDSRGIWFSLEGWNSEGFGNLVACIDDEGNIYTEQAVIPTLNNLTTAINNHNTDSTAHSNIREVIASNTDAISAIKNSEVFNSFLDVEDVITSFVQGIMDIIGTFYENEICTLETESKNLTDAINEIHAEVDAKAIATHSHSYNDLTDKPSIPSIEGLATETYVNEKISEIPTPDVSGQIGTHNVSADAHNDIRLLIEGLTTRLNTLANSDDTTLDQMSEIVAYIKNNKSLIDSITTNKVNVSDVVNNLTTNVSNKPLSAAQGAALKGLIDAISVPTKLSQLTNDKGYLTSYTETDPTVPSWAKAATKPSYSKSEVGLGNVDNVKQYSASNPPVVYQAEAPTDTSVIWVDMDDNSDDGLAEAINEALLQAKASGEFDGMSAEEREKLNNTNIAYGTCSTAADVAEKTVVLDGNAQWSLTKGSIIMVKFDVSNTASSVTINVNGTGAYPIWYNNAEYTSTGTAYTGYANRTITYMFNGTHYVWITSSYDANSTYTNAALGQGYATCSTAAATAAKVGTLSSYKLVTGGIVSVKFTNAVPANATLNINSTGAKSMYFRGAKITADVIKAGDVATFVYSSYYHLISIDRWQNDINSLQTQVSGLATTEYVDNQIAGVVDSVLAALPTWTGGSY